MLRVSGTATCVAVVSVMVMSPLVETAEFLGALNEITLGTGLVNDIADSVGFAMTEVPSLAELGGSLTGLARPDTDHPQQLTQEQRDHAHLAEAFFLSPIGFSLDEMRGLPRLASALVDGDRASRSVNSTTSSSTIMNSDGTTSTSNNKIFSLRGLSGFDQAEMERLAESIAEGVANSAYGFRTKNPLVAALAAVAGQGNPKSEEAVPSAVSQLIDPLGLFSQKPQEKTENDKLAEQEVEQAAEQQAEQEFEKDEKPQLTEEQQLEQQVEQQTEQQVERQAEQQPEVKPEDQVDEPHPLEAAVEQQVIEEEFGGSMSSSTDAEDEPMAEAIAEVAAEEAEPEATESSETAEDSDEAEQDEEEDGKSPQRFFFWSRTNPFGIFQPATDMWYLTNWAFLNPLAMIEWKAFAFNQCMSILNNKELCLKSLKVEPNAVNHGGTNSAWKPSTAP